MIESNIYVLQLTGGYYYVGMTDDVKRRYKQHRSGVGALWTQLHGPIKLVESYKTTVPFEEDRKTKELMAIYGIDKVRGGTYVSEILDEQTVSFLQKEIWTGQNRCGRCGNHGHYITQCNAIRNINGAFIEYMYYR